jgi:uncharacterized membrane protein YadS
MHQAKEIKYELRHDATFHKSYRILLLNGTKIIFSTPLRKRKEIRGKGEKRVIPKFSWALRNVYTQNSGCYNYKLVLRYCT